MKEIDIASWRRREHFELFRAADLPFYNVNARVDISGLREYAKAHSLSFNTLLICLTMRSLNRIENFKLRARGESVVIHEVIHPSFAHLKDGDDLFSFITVDFTEDVFELDRTVRTAIEECHSYFNFEKVAGRDDFVFISAMPWISFTGIDHTLSFNKNDGIPRVTWGKYFDDRGRTQLPFNIRVNHMFVDGLHVGLFFAELNREIEEIREQSRLISAST